MIDGNSNLLTIIRAISPSVRQSFEGVLHPDQFLVLDLRFQDIVFVPPRVNINCVVPDIVGVAFAFVKITRRRGVHAGDQTRL